MPRSADIVAVNHGDTVLLAAQSLLGAARMTSLGLDTPTATLDILNATSAVLELLDRGLVIDSHRSH